MDESDEVFEFLNTNQQIADIVQSKETMKKFIGQFIKFKAKFYQAYKIISNIQQRVHDFITIQDMKTMKTMMIEEIQDITRLYKQELDDLFEVKVKDKVDYKHFQDQLSGKLDKFEVIYLRNELIK